MARNTDTIYDLYDANTNDYIGIATDEQVEASLGCGQPEGIISINENGDVEDADGHGRRVYVLE